MTGVQTCALPIYESITLSEVQYSAINKLFEIGYKHGFYDTLVKVEDFMIPTEYKELRES